MNAGNAASMIAAGAAGVAVVSAIVAADDVEAAARSIRRALDGARRISAVPAFPGAAPGPVAGSGLTE